MAFIYVKFALKIEPQKTTTEWAVDKLKSLVMLKRDELNAVSFETIRVELPDHIYDFQPVAGDRLLEAIGMGIRNAIIREFDIDIGGIVDAHFFNSSYQEDSYHLKQNIEPGSLLSIKNYKSSGRPLLVSIPENIFKLIAKLKAKHESTADEITFKDRPSVEGNMKNEMLQVLIEAWKERIHKNLFGFENGKEIELINMPTNINMKEYEAQLAKLKTRIDREAELAKLISGIDDKTFENPLEPLLNYINYKTGTLFPYKIIHAAYRVHDEIKKIIKEQKDYEALSETEKAHFTKLILLVTSVISDFPTSFDPDFKDSYISTLASLSDLAAEIRGHRSYGEIIAGVVIALIGAVLFTAGLFATLISVGTLSPSLLLSYAGCNLIIAAATWMAVPTAVVAGASIGAGALTAAIGSSLTFHGRRKGAAQSVVELAEVAGKQQRLRLSN